MAPYYHACQADFFNGLLARDIATSIGDTDTVFAVIDDLSQYDVDYLMMKADACATAAGLPSPLQGTYDLFDKADALINDAVTAERLDVAKRVATTATTLAKKTKDADLAKEAASRQEEVIDIEIARPKTSVYRWC